MKILFGTVVLLAAVSFAGCSNENEECFAAVYCVESCGGPVVAAGCLKSCPSGSFSDRACQDAGTSDAGQ